MAKKWKCANWTADTAIDHEQEPCDCSFGCGGELCFTCCETEMYGNVDDESESD